MFKVGDYAKFKHNDIIGIITWVDGGECAVITIKTDKAIMYNWFEKNVYYPDSDGYVRCYINLNHVIKPDVLEILVHEIR